MSGDLINLGLYVRIWDEFKRTYLYGHLLDYSVKSICKGIKYEISIIGSDTPQYWDGKDIQIIKNI